MSTAVALVGELASRKLYGTRLQHWRRDAGLTPRYAANVLGISMPKLRALEEGRCEEPAPSLAMQIYTRTDGAVPPPASNVSPGAVGSRAGASPLTLGEAPGAGDVEGTSPASTSSSVVEGPADAPPQSATVIDGAVAPCAAPSIDLILQLGAARVALPLAPAAAIELAHAIVDAVARIAPSD